MCGVASNCLQVGGRLTPGGRHAPGYHIVTVQCALHVDATYLVNEHTYWIVTPADSIAISCELRVEEARLMLVVFVHKVTYMPV